MARRRGFAERDAVRITEGETLNHDEVKVDVGGMTGVVCDDVPYENAKTGESMIGVKLDSEHGGGHAYVPASRLRPGRTPSVGAILADEARAIFDRIFKTRKRAS